MPRLTTIDPATATGKAKDLFDGPLKAMQINIFKAMANSPAAVQAYLNFSGALSGGALSKKEGEIVALTVSEANGCDYCVAAHTHLGKQAGLSDDQMLGARRAQIGDDPKLHALSQFAMALHEKKGHVSDDDLNRFRSAGYTDAHVVEVIFHYGLAIITNYFNHVNQTAVDFPAPLSV